MRKISSGSPSRPFDVADIALAETVAPCQSNSSPMLYWPIVKNSRYRMITCGLCRIAALQQWWERYDEKK
jgi:hypothetical protein